MKIKLTFVLLFVLSVYVVAQTQPVDFEDAGNGATWEWTVFENSDNPALEIVDNPSMVDPNTSAKVAKFSIRQAGMQWAGCNSYGIGEFTLDETNCTIKIMVYKTVISDVGIKLELNGTSTGEIKVPNTLVNQWEELTFDFSGKIGETNNNLVIFPDFADHTTDHVVYFDNVTFSAQLASNAPEVAAPTPTYPANEVISMFSNAYTDVTVDTWSATWDMADVQDIQIEGNDTKKYSNLTYAGIECGSAPIDATGMTYFHMDIWTNDNITDPSVFHIKLVDFGADGAYAGGDDVEHELSFNNLSTPAITQGEWSSLDIPLADFANMITREHVAQLIISGNPNTVYVDNVFFHAEGVPVELTSFAANVVNENIVLEWLTATETNNKGFEIQRSLDNENFNVIGFIDGKGTTTEKQSYSFTDASIAGGTYFYRLRQVDFDGSFEFSNVVETEFLPTEFTLQQNYPNPFNPATTIKFALPVESKVNITVYNALGQKVTEIANQTFNAGLQNVNFDASELSSGMYIYQINAQGINGNNFTATKKMILMK